MSKSGLFSTLFALAAMLATSGLYAQQTTQQPNVPANQPVTPRGAGQIQGDITSDKITRDSAQQVAGQAHAMTVKEAIVQKLIKSNQAEIELAQLAQQKSENEQVKQFAMMLVKDHQALTQELQQMSGKNNTSARAGQNAPRDRQPGTQVQTSAQQTSQGAIVPQQLQQIASQACDNNLKMTKEMLSNYSGQDFTMAFLGQQAVMHTMTLAELKAIESAGPQEIQPVVQKAISKVESHLQKAKQLAKKLEDDRRSS